MTHVGPQPQIPEPGKITKVQKWKVYGGCKYRSTNTNTATNTCILTTLASQGVRRLQLPKCQGRLQGCEAALRSPGTAPSNNQPCAIPLFRHVIQIQTEMMHLATTIRAALPCDTNTKKKKKKNTHYIQGGFFLLFRQPLKEISELFLPKND